MAKWIRGLKASTGRAVVVLVGSAHSVTPAKSLKMKLSLETEIASRESTHLPIERGRMSEVLTDQRSQEENQASQGLASRMEYS